MKSREKIFVLFFIGTLFYLLQSTFVQAGNIEISDPGQSTQFDLVSTPKNLRVESVKTLDDQTVQVTLRWESAEQYFRLYSKQNEKDTFEPAGYMQTQPLEIRFPVMQPYFSLAIASVKQINNNLVESKRSNEVSITWDRPILSPPEAPTLRSSKQQDDLTTTVHLNACFQPNCY